MISPYIIAFFAVGCYALLGPIAKKIGFHLPPFAFVAISCLLLSISAATISYFFERGKITAALTDFNWGGMIIFSAINLTAYVLYLTAIRKIPIAQYDMFAILMPVIGGLAAVVLLKEPFHARYILAIAVMAVGIYIAVGPELKVK